MGPFILFWHEDTLVLPSITTAPCVPHVSLFSNVEYWEVEGKGLIACQAARKLCSLRIFAIEAETNYLSCAGAPHGNCAETGGHEFP
jgi:hypothetical protein